MSSSSTKPQLASVATALVDEGFTGPLARVAGEDSFIRFAAPVNPTTNPFESAMIFAVSIGGMP